MIVDSGMMCDQYNGYDNTTALVVMPVGRLLLAVHESKACTAGGPCRAAHKMTRFQKYFAVENRMASLLECS